MLFEHGCLLAMACRKRHAICKSRPLKISILDYRDFTHKFGLDPKEHYVLDIDNGKLSKDVVAILETVTPLPKLRKKNK